MNKDDRPSPLRLPPQFTLSSVHVLSAQNPPSDFPSASTSSKSKKKKKKSPVSVIPSTEIYRSPWLSMLGMTEYESKEQRLHDEIVAYASYISPSRHEFQARQLITSAVAATVKKVFREDAAVLTFGSVATQLCLPDSDIDLLIIVDIPSQLGVKNALHQVSSALRFAQVSEKSLVVTRSRIPVITMSTTQSLGSFSVDISINADAGAKAVYVVQDYLNTMPALRPLVFVLKRMLSQCELNSSASAGLSTYSLICMVINFLQVNPKRRSIESIEHPMEQESLGSLLLDFLFYYTEEFDYETSRICVAPPGDKPSHYRRLKDSDHLLSISCLVDPGNDIGRSTTKLERIVSAFRDAYTRIQQYPFSIQHDNCLGTIVGLPQDMIDRREFISRMVTSGSLEAEINKCIVYMARITPLAYPQKSKPVNRGDNIASSSSTPRGVDSYRPPYAESSGSVSKKRVRDDSPPPREPPTGPKAWRERSRSRSLYETDRYCRDEKESSTERSRTRDSEERSQRRRDSWSSQDRPDRGGPQKARRSR